MRTGAVRNWIWERRKASLRSMTVGAGWVMLVSMFFMFEVVNRVFFLGFSTVFGCVDFACHRASTVEVGGRD